MDNLQILQNSQNILNFNFKIYYLAIDELFGTEHADNPNPIAANSIAQY